MNQKINKFRICRLNEFCKVFLLLAISICFVSAQSKNMDIPTPITNGRVSTFFDNKDSRTSFYYSYKANSGELKITLSLEAGSWSINQITLDVFGENTMKLTTKTITSGLGKTEQAIIQIPIEKQQNILLRVFIDHADKEAQFRLRLENSETTPINSTSSVDNLPNGFTLCRFCYFGTPNENINRWTAITEETKETEKAITKLLPKEGQMTIRTKDSIVIINLREVVNIFIQKESNP